MMRRSAWFGLLIASSFCLSACLRAEDFEQEPIRYGQTRAENAIEALQRRLDAGQVRLDFDERTGYVRAVLRELGVSTKSQTLVFSKTSLQRNKITPRAPRSLFFNDQVYVGFCQGGEVVEISAADPNLGTVFYTLDQEPTAKPKFARQGDACLQCHASSHTLDVPGHMIRSVFVDGQGQPLLAAGSFRIDQTSPFDQRWGGWYVTGTHGNQQHLGNLVVRQKQVAAPVDNSAGMNVRDLGDRFPRDGFLSPHSDIVALLVLEHQAMAHNLLTRANFQSRLALHHEAGLNRELNQPKSQRWESTTTRINAVVEPLVKYLLFSGEAPLTAKIAGTAGYAEAFAQLGPRDPKGRALRDFDLQKRIFKYPCSYLIYSASFDALPDEVRGGVLKRIWNVLVGVDRRPDFAHLSAADRQAILEILLATKSNLPAYWHPPRA